MALSYRYLAREYAKLKDVRHRIPLHDLEAHKLINTRLYALYNEMRRQSRNVPNFYS